MTNKNTYRVFAFSEHSIHQYSESKKKFELFLDEYPKFDTIIMYFDSTFLSLVFLKEGKKVWFSNFPIGEYPVFHFIIELAGTIQPEQKEEPLFCVGDRVFDWRCGWMTINEVKSHGSIILKDDDYKEHIFNVKDIERLSFTEYNFITGGWSQERPPEVGSWGWFWDDEYDLVSEEVVYGKLQKVEDSVYYTNENKYNNFSTKNHFLK